MKKNLLKTLILLLVCSMTALFMGCKKDKVAPEEATPMASFTVSNSNVKIGETVFFSNNSTSASRYEWSFGDGHSSTDNSPIHSYSNAGIYTVKLTAYSASGVKKNEATNTIYVTKPVGDAMFWISQSTYVVSVTLLGNTKTIDLYYSSSTPTCGDAGCANFLNIDTGTHSFYAENSLYWWSGTITVRDDDCSKIRLYFDEGNPRNPLGEKTELMGPVY